MRTPALITASLPVTIPPFSRIVHKIIVDGKVSDLDSRACDNRFKMHCLCITSAEIYLVLKLVLLSVVQIRI